MKRRSVLLFSSRVTLIATLCSVSLLLSGASAFAQGAPRSGGSTTGGRPTGSGGTTPSTNNPGSSPISPPDRPKANPIPLPSTAPLPSPSQPVIIVNPQPYGLPYGTPYVPPYVAPTYNPAYPFTSLPSANPIPGVTSVYGGTSVPGVNAPENVIVQPPQAVQGRPVSGTNSKLVPASNTVISQIIQQKGNVTRYMIVDPQAHTVSIVRVKLPANANGVAEVVCESVAPYGGVKKP